LRCRQLRRAAAGFFSRPSVEAAARRDATPETTRRPVLVLVAAAFGKSGVGAVVWRIGRLEFSFGENEERGRRGVFYRTCAPGRAADVLILKSRHFMAVTDED
jgi:hypothetical protein